MSDIDALATIAREKKQAILNARACGADYDTLKRLCAEYADACAAWHKVRFPGKKFNKPSTGYLLRAL